MKTLFKHQKSTFKRIFKKHKLLLRSIAVSLVLALLFTSLPMDGIIALAEQAIEDSKLITVVEELEEYRTEFSKTYLKSDGTLEAVVSSNPIHFNEDGEWVEIDSTLETAENEKGTEILKNKKGSFNVELPAELQNSSEIAIEKGKNKISIKLLETKKSKAKKNNEKKEKSEKLTKAQRKRMTAGELFEADNNQSSAVEYTSAYNETNIRYDVTPNEVKESIVLQKAPNKKATYSYEITADGLTAILNEDNSIDFFEGSKMDGAEPVFSMPAPHMFDSNDEYSYDIATTLENKKGKYILTYKPSYEWLKSKDRAYPVTIDPTVTINSGIQDSYTFSGEGYGDSYTGYEQQLKVGTTAWIAPNDYWQTYLKFTDLPQIPYEDYRIDSAYLMLTPKATTGNWQEMELGVYELTEDWKNHQTGKVAERITFNNAPEDVGYSTATATVSRGGADNGVGVGFEIAHLMEKWYENPEENFGIKLAAHLEASQWNDNLVFHSSRSQTGTAPYLSLTYKGVVPVTDIEILNKIEKIQDIQEYYWIPEATVYPENASDKRITWESSDSDIMCYSYGYFYVSKPGTVTITARSVDNPEIFDSFDIIVYNVPVEGVYIYNKPENNELCVGEEHYLSFGTLPQNASYTDLDFNTILWQSDNPTVATVDEYGNVSAHYPGTANISFSCDGFTDSFELTVVYAPIEKVEIVNLPENNTLTVNESWHLGALVYPQEETIQPRTIWTSSDTSILSVDSDGRLIPIKSGTVTITASCGDKSDSCEITVEDLLVDSIALLHGINELTLTQHSSYQIDVVVMPFEATNQNVIMTSSDESIVSVSGIIATMENLGTATVYIAAADSGTIFNSITFTVIAQEEILNIPEDYHLEVGESWQFFDVPYLEIVASEPNIFTIDGGIITAQEAGLTYLEIRNIYSNDIVAEVYLSIEPKNLRILGIPEELRVGNWVDFISLTSDCGATFNPSETGWTSSNPEVFQITRGSEHEIYGHALSAGTATIHAYVPYYGANVYFTVTVKYIKPDKISLALSNGETDFTIWVNGLFSGYATVTPKEADWNYNRVMLDWYATNDNVSLIGEGYRSAAFLGKKVGTSKVYAMADGVKSNELNVTIKAPTAIITNKPNNNTLYKGSTHTLGYKCDLTEATVTFHSSNSSIAKIDKQTGMIEANSVGSVTISIKVKYGDYLEITDSFSLDVLGAGIVIDGNTKELLTVGEKTPLTATVYAGANASQEVVWSTDDPSVATVDSNGLVTAIAPGEVIISAKSKQYDYAVATVYFEVDLPAPTKIALSETSGTLCLSKQKKLIPTVTPSNSSTNFVWESKNSNIAHVSDDGTITAKNPGTTKITVYSKRNPNAKAEYTLTVKNNISYIISLPDEQFVEETNDMQQRLAEKYYNGDKNFVDIQYIKNATEFFAAWDNIGKYNGYEVKVDYVIVNTHATPSRIEGDEGTEEEPLKYYFVISIDALKQKLTKKEMKGMLVLGCNAGVVEYSENNVASVFCEKINGAPLLACDGYVVYKNGRAWEDYNPHFKIDILPDGVLRDPYGWVLYYWKNNRSNYKLLNQGTILINKLDEYFSKMEE